MGQMYMSYDVTVYILDNPIIVGCRPVTKKQKNVTSDFKVLFVNTFAPFCVIYSDFGSQAWLCEYLQ